MTKVRNILESLVLKYLDKDFSNTAPILDFINSPTGSGKSTTVLKAIASKLPKTEHQYIFAVPTKEFARDSYNKMISFLKDNQLNERSAILLKSYEDDLRDGWNEAYDFYCKKRSSIGFSEDTVNIIESIHNIIMSGRTFDREISELKHSLKKDYHKLKDRQKDTFKVQSFISKLFPSHNALRYDPNIRVVFCTIHKLPHKIWDFSGSEFLFELDKFSGNTHLFIDEIDLSKEIFLNIFAQNEAESSPLRIISTLRQIHKSKIAITKYIRNKTKRKNKRVVVDEYFESLKNYIKSHNLENDFFKLDKKSVSRFYNQVIVHTSSSHIIRASKMHYQLNKNILQLSDNNELIADNNKEVREFFDVSVQLLLGFAKFAARVTEVREDNERDDEKSDHQIAELLNSMNLHSDNKTFNYLSVLIKSIARQYANNKIRHKKREMIEVFNHFSFFRRGLSCQVLKMAQEAHALELYFHQLRQTPEEFLSNMVVGFGHVTGLSATAMHESVISNYSHNYLKYNLNQGYHGIDDHFSALIGKEMYKIWEKISPIKDESVIVFDKNLNSESINREKDLSRFGIRRGADGILTEVCSIEPFRYGQFFNLLHAIKHFLESKAHSLLIVLNYKIEDDTHNKEFASHKKRSLLNGCIEKIISTVGLEQSVDELVFYHAASKDGDFVELKHFLGSGQKKIIISNQRAMGTAVSLEYELANKQLKDIDSLYFQTPTHLIEKLSEDRLNNIGISQDSIKNNIPTLIKSSFKYFTLIEGVASPEISSGSVVQALSFNAAKGVRRDPYKSTCDYANNVYQRVVQLCGRLYRTNCNKNITVYIENELLHELSKASTSKIHATPIVNEIMRLSKVETLKEVAAKREKDSSKVTWSAKHFSQKMLSVYSDIRSGTLDSSSERVHTFRKSILMNPTIDNDAIESSIYSNLYILNSNEEYKKYCDDYLSIFMRSNAIRNYFINEGFATSFNKDYILHENIFNDFYKGTLGEEIFRFWAKTEKLNICELENKYFEYFDFKIGNCVIDVKNYKPSFRKSEKGSLSGLLYGDENKPGAISKMSQMGLKDLIIVNVTNFVHYGDEIYEPVERTENGYRILIVPAIYLANTGMFIQGISEKIRHFIKG